VLRERISEGRGRDGENTLRFKQFPGGFLAIASRELAGGARGAQLRARLLRRGRSLQSRAGTEGMPAVHRRAAHGRDRRRRAGDGVDAGRQGDERSSSPRSSRATSGTSTSPAPHCGHEQRLVFGTKTSPGGLRWERGKPETPWYRCEAQGCRIEEKHKGWMLERGGGSREPGAAATRAST
jgi:hypothetical protein